MDKKNVLVRIPKDVEMALRSLDPEKKMSLSRALIYICKKMNLKKKESK